MSNEMKDWLYDNLFEEMSELVNLLNDYTKAYDEGHPKVSDREWDELYFKLVDIENKVGYSLPNSPTQVINYEVVNELQKVKHNHFMSSLAKTKDWDEFIRYFGNKDVIGMLKLDGLTCSLHYLDGRLVGAETRGNGEVGEDILHNAKVLPSIPNRINYRNELIIDGEIICDVETFNKDFAEDYANPRNFAAGSIRLLDSQECKNRHLTFVAWNIVTGFEETNSFMEKLNKLEKLGFVVTPWTSSFDWDAKEFLIDRSKELGYPIDGLVGRFDDIEYGISLGSTGHHSKAAYAFKFYDEVYETTLIKIEWTMGRTGILTPVAVFEPLDIEGSVVERASLHNISVMNALSGGFERVGDKLLIYKANMIIPQVDTWYHVGDYSEENHLSIPEVCPICGGPTKIVKSDSGVENLVCINPDCEGKLINKLDHFAGKKGLDIKGLSKATLEKLIDWDWINSISDLYSLQKHEMEWKNKPGFGKRSVENILSAIEASKKCELQSFISALGIPLIGATYAKEISKKEKGWIQFREDIKNKYDFTKWDGFGPETCLSLWHFKYNEADYLAENVLTISNSLWKNPNETDKANSSLTGMTIVITGKLVTFKNRAMLQSAIESAGGKVVGSVSKNTNILINNDATSTSSKNLSAQKLGIPIMTELEFKEKFLDK